MKRLFLAFVAIVSIGLAGAFANYTMTQGAGTTFGSVVVGGFHYVQMFVCDLTTPAQCQAVSAAGAAKVDGSAVTQPVSGTVTANAGTNLNTSALATSANQTNGTQQGKVTDGSNIAAVKAASTAPAATDPALVVALSPNGAQATSALQTATNTALGTTADTPCTLPATATTCSQIAIQKAVANTGLSPLPAQTGIGNVNIGAVQSAGSKFIAVAASSTATVLQTSTGAIGDYLSHCVIYPTSTSPGVVTVFDNTNTAATSAILFAGGATSTSNLTPISVPVGAISTAGAWKVTTGTAVSVVCYGKFS